MNVRFVGRLLMLTLAVLIILTAVLWHAEKGKSAVLVQHRMTTAPNCLTNGRINITPNHSTPLNFWMVPGRDDPAQGTVDAYLMVTSCTDMPVPDVTVTIGTCDLGQKVPFTVDRTRHLGQSESLTAISGGMIVAWHSFSAPAFNANPLTLHVRFHLTVGRGGPVFCIRGYGYTSEGADSTPFIDLNWWLK